MVGFSNISFFFGIFTFFFHLKFQVGEGSISILEDLRIYFSKWGEIKLCQHAF